MKPEMTDLCAGLAGVSLIPTTYDLGHGIQLSQTYAHFMAPFMMAFVPPKKGTYQEPWKAARGGLAIDINAELFMPFSYRPNHLNRLNTIWWIVALLRMKVGTAAFVPVISTEHFANILSLS